jgi:branched-chain amino acid transport system permease protein
MARFLQYLFDGLSLGAVYALLALGLVIIYRTSGQLNFAQGEMAMVAAFGAWWFGTLGLPIALAVLAATGAAFVGAGVIERVVVRPVRGRSPLAVVVVAIALFLGLNGLPSFVWRATTPERFPAVFPNDPDDFVRIGGATWRHEHILVLGTALAVSALLALLFRRTKLGLAMRAVASNPESAPLAGIDTGRVFVTAWALAAAVGAVAGSLTASLRGSVDPTMMLTIFLAAAAAATLGGLDSLPGAVVGGLVLGVVENMAAGYQPDLIGQDLRSVVGLLVILVVLLVRPSGLFGSPRVERV